VTTSSSAAQPNRLIHETSPYLLEHAHNPVDWYAWGPEALTRAHAEDKPILLSIGYSACHWCHVMAHESFEDPAIAALMNRLFVSIKVDREERPDLDAIYMEAVQAMTGQGGWPMTVFLTPEGRPFYGGAYFPPAPRYGMPSFRQVLQAVADAWRDRRQELEAAGERIAGSLKRSAAIGPSDALLTPALLDRAARNLLQALDRHEGGLGGAPKFPQPMALDFMLQLYMHTGEEELLEAVNLTLTKMAGGGVYDQLGGGFHRYSTDARWLVPHFEKMLYDNAQLARIYLHAWQITGGAEYRRVVEETLDYMLREMTSLEGGFYSTEDADSEGQEGRFYLWTPDEIASLLGEEDARLFCAYYDVTSTGNFHEGGSGHNILHITHNVPATAEVLNVTGERLSQALRRGRDVLFAARQKRVRPGQDQKVLAEWNGLMLHAFAEAGAALGRADYLAAATRTGQFLLAQMAYLTADGSLRLYRSYKGGEARLPAYLEDYASVALGMLALYEAVLDPNWLQAAVSLAKVILTLFADPAAGGFFQVGNEHEKLIARRKDFIDSAVPSGNSMAVEMFLRLGKLMERTDYTAHGAAVLQMLAGAMTEQPAAFGRLLCALDFHLNPGFEIAIAGNVEREDSRALLTQVWRRYLPNSVLALHMPGDERAASLVPFLAGREPIKGRSAAYVCRNYVCNLPVTDPLALAAQLER
jgi:uncharacterized protein YyaL (SSP411 family)